MVKSPSPNIAFIIDTLETINTNTPRNKSEFMSDPNVQDATLMRLQDIGEQLSRIRDQFPEFFEMNQDDSWHKFIGVRNIISHGYREIDFDIIWDILETKLSAFSDHIRKITKN